MAQSRDMVSQNLHWVISRWHRPAFGAAADQLMKGSDKLYRRICSFVYIYISCSFFVTLLHKSNNYWVKSAGCWYPLLLIEMIESTLFITEHIQCHCSNPNDLFYLSGTV